LVLSLLVWPWGGLGGRLGGGLGPLGRACGLVVHGWLDRGEKAGFPGLLVSLAQWLGYLATLGFRLGLALGSLLG
jgi:hypothetical protein